MSHTHFSVIVSKMCLVLMSKKFAWSIRKLDKNCKKDELLFNGPICNIVDW